MSDRVSIYNGNQSRIQIGEKTDNLIDLNYYLYADGHYRAGNIKVFNTDGNLAMIETSFITGPNSPLDTNEVNFGVEFDYFNDSLINFIVSLSTIQKGLIKIYDIKNIQL